MLKLVHAGSLTGTVRMRPRNRILFWVGLGLGTSVLVFVSATRSSQSMDVSVLYLRTENYKAWGPSCFFGITNKSSFPVKRWDGIQVEQKTGSYAGVTYNPPKLLAPGEGETVVLQRPTSQEAWRLQVPLSRNSLRNRLSYFVRAYSWSKYLPFRLRGTPIDFRESDWVRGG